MQEFKKSPLAFSLVNRDRQIEKHILIDRYRERERYVLGLFLSYEIRIPEEFVHLV